MHEGLAFLLFGSQKEAAAKESPRAYLTNREGRKDEKRMEQANQLNGHGGEKKRKVVTENCTQQRGTVKTWVLGSQTASSLSRAGLRLSV